jgi:hypothetical protein
MARLPRLLMTAGLLLLAVPSTARGQGLADYDYENLTFRGIGIDYGYIWPNKVEPTHVMSLRLDLGYLGPAIRILPQFAFWESTFRQVELDRFADRLSQLPALAEQGVVLTGADLGAVDLSNLSLGIDAHVVWTAPFDIITFIGAGAGIHALNGRGPAVDGTFVEDLLDGTSAGLALLAGFEVQPVQLLRIYAEARYTFVTNVSYPGIRLGAALMLPPRARANTQGGR